MTTIELELAGTSARNCKHHHNNEGAAAGFFNITGTSEPLFFSQAGVSGSANGSPQSNGYTLSLSWCPPGVSTWGCNALDICHSMGLR